MAARGYGDRRFDPNEIPWERIVKVAPLVLLLALILPVSWKGFYTVQPHEQAVVLRFGKHYATTGPGLHFMIPLVDQAVPVSVEEHRLRLPFGESSEEPRATNSRDSANREEPLMLTGDLSATPIAQPAVEETTKVLVGREKIIQEIKRKAMQDLAGEEVVGRQTGRGIELIDVGIAGIDFVPQVREAAFDRIIAMMQASASFYTNEGEREKQEILNSTNAEVQKIEGEGKEESNRLRGDVDAEIITSYAKAIEQAGEFYTFVRTLEAYKKALGNNTRLILTTDSEFFRLLKDIGKAEPVSPRPTSRPVENQ